MDKPMSPRDGDVVVTRESRSPIVFTIRQLPGDAQLSASSRDDAIRLARGFAMKNAVNVWYFDGESVRLLEAYRRTNDRPDSLSETPAGHLLALAVMSLELQRALLTDSRLR